MRGEEVRHPDDGVVVDPLGKATAKAMEPGFGDGQSLKEALRAGTAWLIKHSAAVDSLNVFPVPDGDTGSNMCSTMRAAIEEIRLSPSHSASAMADKVAHGALMGARGNSGVILSQILRGFAKGLSKKERFGGLDFATALKEGSNWAYKAVIKPVEGTILTVARESADAAVLAAQDRDQLGFVLERAIEAARGSVSRTPDLLPALKEAGVVDAGGEGFRIFLEGIAKGLAGVRVEPGPRNRPEQRRLVHPAGPNDYGYCTSFVLQGWRMDFERIKERIASLGDSAAVIGDEHLIKVHVHTRWPGTVLNYAVRLGTLRQVSIQNMQDQVEGVSSDSREIEPDIGVVAVTRGKGLSELFSSLGARPVKPAGLTASPSIDELLTAVEDLPNSEILILPNHPDVIPIAQEVVGLAAKRVGLVPAYTIPQGVAALVAFDYGLDLDGNVHTMGKAAANVETAEIVVAARKVQINGVHLDEGEIVGILNGSVTLTAESLEEAVWQVLKAIRADKHEILTFYYGEDVQVGEAQQLTDQVRSEYPQQTVDLLAGNQPYYRYIISAE